MIIGIAGKKGTGKDTAAEYISKTFNLKKVSFAGPIKAALNIIFDWTDDVWKQDKKELIDNRWGISPRQAAQHLGTEWAQFGLSDSFSQYAYTTGRKLWVRRVLTDNIVISDVRFPHEAEAIWEYGGITIKLERNTDTVDLHPSEVEIDDIPNQFVITNNETVEVLYERLYAIVGVYSDFHRAVKAVKKNNTNVV
jgi:hypothetical protein